MGVTTLIPAVRCRGHLLLPKRPQREVAPQGLCGVLVTTVFVDFYDFLRLHHAHAPSSVHLPGWPDARTLLLIARLGISGREGHPVPVASVASGVPEQWAPPGFFPPRGCGKRPSLLAKYARVAGDRPPPSTHLTGSATTTMKTTYVLLQDLTRARRGPISRGLRCLGLADSHVGRGEGDAQGRAAAVTT